MSNEEWGEWQIHDGKGCPVLGQWVESVERCGLTEQHVAGGIGDGRALQWNWRNKLVPRGMHIIRYRVRKPRGLTILQNLVASLDAPEGPAKTPRKVKA